MQNQFPIFAKIFLCRGSSGLDFTLKNKLTLFFLLFAISHVMLVLKEAAAVIPTFLYQAYDATIAVCQTLENRGCHFLNNPQRA